MGQQATSVSGLQVHTEVTGGSCPFIYVWDGARYVLEGETFGTAVGKALETSTRCTLPAALEGHELDVRISNERPETHYINRATVTAYEAPRGSAVYLDEAKHAWAVAHPLQPLNAPDELRRRDGVFWRSDLSSTKGDYRDVVELTVPRERPAAQGSLIIRAINTHLFTSVYESVFRYLGDESLQFVYALEHDPDLVKLIRDWIVESALRVEVLQDGSWRAVGEIMPEADEVPISRIVRIPCSGGDSVRIRLSMLADTWKIDAVEVDWTSSAPLEEHNVPMVSAMHSKRGEVTEMVRSTDRSYAMLLPGEWIDLRFESYASQSGGRVTYALESGGYLYEWLPAPAAEARAVSDAPSKVECVKALLRNRSVFLEGVFARWKEVRASGRE